MLPPENLYQIDGICNTFYPFQNKHQIHAYLQSVKMLCALENLNLVSHEMG